MERINFYLPAGLKQSLLNYSLILKTNMTELLKEGIELVIEKYQTNVFLKEYNEKQKIIKKLEE